MSKKNYLIVDKKDEDERIDKFLLKKYKNFNFIKIQKLIRIGFFKVNLKKKKSNYRIKANDKIFYRLPPDNAKAKENNYEYVYKNEIEILKKNIIYQDGNILVLNKPQGIAVQGGSKINFNIDLVLKHICQDNKELKLVHRIDKNTTGLLLIAKSKRIAKKLSGLFKESKVFKVYWSICVGKPKKKSGYIKHPLIKSRIKGKEIMIIDNNKNKKAETFYKVIQYKKGFSLMHLEPKTGRTHQIRAHLKALDIPILGDHKYTTEEILKNKNFSNHRKMHLHSRQLIFNLENKEYNFKANLPKDFLITLKEHEFKIEEN